MYVWVFPQIGGFYPQNAWFISWKTLLKWMIWRPTPIFGNTRMVPEHQLVLQNWVLIPFVWNHPRQRWLHRTLMRSSVALTVAERSLWDRANLHLRELHALVHQEGKPVQFGWIQLQMAQVESETKQSPISPQPRKSSCKWKCDDGLCPILFDLFNSRFCLDTPNRNPAWPKHFGGFEACDCNQAFATGSRDIYIYIFIFVLYVFSYCPVILIYWVILYSIYMIMYIYW